MPKSSSKFEHIFLYYLHEDMVTSNTVGGSAVGLTRMVILIHLTHTLLEMPEILKYWVAYSAAAT